VVGAGGGIWSFIHIDDAAAATAVAVEGGERGICNVVDDDPAAAPGLDARAGARAGRQAPAARAALARSAPGRAIDVPTLIVHGDGDQIVPISASAERSSTLVPDSTWAIRDP
jgi:pimeloyl-ACP methyl ester carboxylesterase